MFLVKKAITIPLFRSKILFQAPFLKYAFAMSPSLKEFKEIMPYDKLPKVDDELHFPHENEDVNGGLQTVSFIFIMIFFLVFIFIIKS